jgi:hypothetical protein
MVIGPLNSNFLRADLFAPRGQTQAAGPQAVDPGVPGGTAAPVIGQRTYLRLQELMQTGRQDSALLSTLPGPNPSFFQAPGPAEAGFLQGPAGAGGREGRPLNMPLLEAERTGSVTSTLLSGLMAPGRPLGGSIEASPFAQQPAAGFPSGDALNAMRTAQEVLQTVGVGLPSTQDMRIAVDAYRMETQAQLDYARRAAGGAVTQEWFA